MTVKMDDKMKAAFDAWSMSWTIRGEIPLHEDIVDWTLDYLRSQQEPVYYIAYNNPGGHWQYEPANKGDFDAIGLYRHPIPSAPAVPEGFGVWHKGHPTGFRANEWFIARVKGFGRAVLTALPENYTYDFKTADETYYKKDLVAEWMPFPDSEYLPPDATPSPTEKKES